MLAWSAQLDVDSAKRARQGHHQNERTVILYGRDDVSLALKLQEQVLRALRGGWRPMRAQLRGAAPPAAELDVKWTASELGESEFAPGYRVAFQPKTRDSLCDLLPSSDVRCKQPEARILCPFSQRFMPVFMCWQASGASVVELPAMTRSQEVTPAVGRRAIIYVVLSLVCLCLRGT